MTSKDTTSDLIDTSKTRRKSKRSKRRDEMNFRKSYKDIIFESAE